MPEDRRLLLHRPGRPVVLDLCCKAGGMTKGLQRAGFHVIGVDKDPQPNYVGDEFIQEDALHTLRTFPHWGRRIAAIHASFPCQTFTDYKRRGAGVGEGYENLIPEGRELLEATGLPYVIENVYGARSELRDPVMLCGSSFGLDVRRHRLFETNFPVLAPPCAHGWQTPRFPAATNRAPNSRRTVEVGVRRIPLAVQQRAMGIDWMTLEELSEAIPPAYGEYIGRFLMRAVLERETERAAA